MVVCNFNLENGSWINILLLQMFRLADIQSTAVCGRRKMVVWESPLQRICKQQLRAKDPAIGDLQIESPQAVFPNSLCCVNNSNCNDLPLLQPNYWGVRGPEFLALDHIFPDRDVLEADECPIMDTKVGDASDSQRHFPACHGVRLDWFHPRTC